MLKTSTTPPVEPIVHSQTVPASSYKSDSIHTDIYFEVGRKGLTDDAKAILATQADLAKNDPDLGILVQGYTDQQGSVSYNNKLGLMRAEKVKEFMIGRCLRSRHQGGEPRQGWRALSRQQRRLPQHESAGTPRNPQDRQGPYDSSDRRH